MKWAHCFDRIRQGTVPEALRTEPDAVTDLPTADDLELPEYMSEYGPLISVVIPTYGDARFLPDALSTVVHQTYRNLEVIIVDASEVEWLKTLAEDRDWIRYLNRPPNGLSNARNEAIEQARGDYVALLDADDLWHPKKLERQLTAMRTDSSVCYSALWHLDLTIGEDVSIDQMDTTLQDPDRAWIDRAHNRIYAMPSTLLLDRDRIPPRPFAEEVKVCEDFVFDVEMFHSEPPTHIEAPLVLYRNREGSLSNESMEAVHKGLLQAVEVLCQRLPDDTYPQLRSALAVIERDYAEWLYRAGQTAAAKRHLVNGHIHKGLSEAKFGQFSHARAHFQNATKMSTEHHRQRVCAEIATMCFDAGYNDFGQQYLQQATGMSTHKTNLSRPESYTQEK